MEKIDRLGWAAGISFTSYGVRVGVRVNDATILEQLLDRFPPGWKPSSSLVVERLYSLVCGGSQRGRNVRRFNLLYGDIARLVRSLDEDEVFETFESDLQLYVAEAARRRVFVHAGVVGWNGRAILIPGRSHTGKTTLTAEFVRAGATYYSDEYAVLDSSGKVHAYPKALAIRNGNDSRQEKRRVESLGGRAGVKPLSVALVVITEFKKGARWRPRQLSAGNGALALLANTVSARSRPEAALFALQQVVSHARILKSARGEARDTVDLILNQLKS